MRLSIDFTGDVVERQELLNGTQSIDIEGVDPAGGWTLAGSFSWNLGLVDHTGEGDLALSRPGGAEIYATLIRASVASADDSADADFSFTLDYDIDGGTGEFADTRGTARAQGELAGETFHGTWTLELSIP